MQDFAEETIPKRVFFMITQGGEDNLRIKAPLPAGETRICYVMEVVDTVRERMPFRYRTGGDIILLYDREAIAVCFSVTPLVEQRNWETLALVHGWQAGKWTIPQPQQNQTTHEERFEFKKKDKKTLVLRLLGTNSGRKVADVNAAAQRLRQHMSFSYKTTRNGEARILSEQTAKEGRIVVETTINPFVPMEEAIKILSELKFREVEE